MRPHTAAVSTRRTGVGGVPFDAQRHGKVHVHKSIQTSPRTSLAAGGSGEREASGLCVLWSRVNIDKSAYNYIKLRGGITLTAQELGGGVCRVGDRAFVPLRAIRHLECVAPAHLFYLAQAR